MYTVDLYLRVRLACHIDVDRFGIARETVSAKAAAADDVVRRQPPKRPECPAPSVSDIIDRILEEDRPVAVTRRSVYSSAFATNMASRAKSRREAITFGNGCLRRREMCAVVHSTRLVHAGFGLGTWTGGFPGTRKRISSMA